MAEVEPKKVESELPSEPPPPPAPEPQQVEEAAKDVSEEKSVIPPPAPPPPEEKPDESKALVAVESEINLSESRLLFFLSHQWVFYWLCKL